MKTDGWTSASLPAAAAAAGRLLRNLKRLQWRQTAAASLVGAAGGLGGDWREGISPRCQISGLQRARVSSSHGAVGGEEEEGRGDGTWAHSSGS